MNSALAPMRVIERSIYRGPHLYSRRPMIRIRLDLGALEDYPTHHLPGFSKNLVNLLPGLAQHGCSFGTAGGFVRRMEMGTWLGHVIEHVAIELQSQAGAKITRGKTRSVKRQRGVYDILFCYTDNESGLAAGRAAIELVARLLPAQLQQVEDLDKLGPAIGDAGDVPALIAALSKCITANGLGPSTAAIVQQARRRGIVTTRLDRASLIQLGTGSRQRRIRASVTDGTSLIAANLAAHKHAAKSLLAEAGLPVPHGKLVRSLPDALAAAQRLGWPLVVKPLDGNHGRGVTTDVKSEDMLAEAFARAAQISRRVIIERHLAGHDHRILVVNGKVAAVAERLAAHVVGDGRSDIKELIDRVNEDPRRGIGHEAVLTRIEIDAVLEATLHRAGLCLGAVPLAGQRVMLRGTANLSTGGTAIDRTDEIHADNAAIAVQAAAIIGLDVAGIDMMTNDISRSLMETGGAIVEVNAAPGLRMHLAPSEGKPRNVAVPIVEGLFPRGSTSQVPIFAVTGTNGKTTTVRMVSHILTAAGHRVGFTSTTGVYIGGVRQSAADASGPKSAQMVLRNPTVDAAVLETARGGILREGLGFNLCDVGAVLNISEDHLGIRDIHSVEDLARVKSVVIQNVKRRGASVLNADDPMTVKIARHARGRIIWFSAQSAAQSPLVRDHLAAGGMAVTLENNMLTLHDSGTATGLLSVFDMPSTLGGAAAFNVANALAAAAMTAAHGVSAFAIIEGLRSFQPSFEHSPGRLNILEAHGITIIVDYAHNPAALKALGDLVSRFRTPTNRILAMIGIPGDRRDEDLRGIGALSSSLFDEIMFREAPDGRGRPAGTMNELMAEGARSAGHDESAIYLLVNEEAATECCLARAKAGDVVVLTPTNIDGIWARVQAFAADPLPSISEFSGKEAAHG